MVTRLSGVTSEWYAREARRRGSLSREARPPPQTRARNSALAQRPLLATRMQDGQHGGQPGTRLAGSMLACMTILALSVLPAPLSPLIRMACRCSSIIMAAYACGGAGGGRGIVVLRLQVQEIGGEGAGAGEVMVGVQARSSDSGVPSEGSWCGARLALRVVSGAQSRLPDQTKCPGARRSPAAAAARVRICSQGAQLPVEAAPRVAAPPCGAPSFSAPHLLCNGVHVRAELPQRHPAVLRHHAGPVQLAQPLVRVGLQAEAGQGRRRSGTWRCWRAPAANRRAPPRQGGAARQHLRQRLPLASERREPQPGPGTPPNLPSPAPLTAIRMLPEYV